MVGEKIFAYAFLTEVDYSLLYRWWQMIETAEKFFPLFQNLAPLPTASKIMAKTKSPLLSAEAHGKLGRSLVYSKKKAGLITRRMHYPKKEPTLKQWTRRHIVGLLTAHWQCMTDNEHASWNALAEASGFNIPGYQYFLKSAQADLYTHHGLVLYFAFNEITGENTICSACDMIMGILYPSYPENCPTRVPSLRKEYGNALLFDGVDDWVRVNWNYKFNITEQITLEAWIKRDELADGYKGILSNYEIGDWRRCYSLQTHENKLYFCWGVGIAGLDTLESDLTINFEWCYVAAVLGLDDKVRLFINGEEDPNTADLTSLNSYEQWMRVGSYAGVREWFGNIDEVRIYNRGLSAAEIKKHYQLLRLDKKRQPLLRL